MLFSSPIFLYLFFPFILTSYFFIPKPLRNTFLVLASFFFYFWGEGFYVVILIGSIIVNYFFIWLLGRFSHNILKKKLVLIIAILANIGLLVVFKYLDFIVININFVLGMRYSYRLPEWNIPLAIGISFITFHAISYLEDVYKGTKPQRNIVNLSLYFSFFPQLIAGPIIRYHSIADAIVKRETTINLFIEGSKRFILGLSKKILIADNLGLISDAVFSTPPNEISMSMAWFGLLCYALQIYFDFSGYTDMAIGMGRMFGFHFPENFNYPYISQSITEFWRRWHISLSLWFKDYVYIPLGGNREGKWKTYRNLVLVFLLVGVWHGASINFIVWGLWYGFFLVLEKTIIGSVLLMVWRPLRHVYAMLVVILGWVFFRSSNLDYATDFIRTLFGLGQVSDYRFFEIHNQVLAALFFGLIFIFPIHIYLQSIFDKYLVRKIRRVNKMMSFVLDLVYVIILFMLLVLSSMQIALQTYNPFIYFRF